MWTQKLEQFWIIHLMSTNNYRYRSKLSISRKHRLKNLANKSYKNPRTKL